MARDAAGLDKDWGTDRLRLGLQNGLDVEAILRPWEPGVRAFETVREPFLLYT